MTSPLNQSANQSANRTAPRTGRRSAAPLRLALAGAALMLAMLFQFLRSVSDWSAVTADPAGFASSHAWPLAGLVVGGVLVVVGVVQGLRR